MSWEDVIKVSFDEFMGDERVERVKQTERKHPSLPSFPQMPPSKDFPKIKHTPMKNFDSKKLNNILQREKELESIAHDEQDLKYLKTLNPQKLKQVLEARKRVSQGIPSDAPTTERIPQWKKKLQKGAADDREELRERGLISGYDPKDVIEWDKGYEDRQLKLMLSKIEEWAKKFNWERYDIDNPIEFRQNRNEMYHILEEIDYDSLITEVHYEINNYFEDLDGEDELVLGTLDGGLREPVSNFKLNPKLKYNRMKYKNEISQLYRDLTFERLIR